jgi:hypothetical protein
VQVFSRQCGNKEAKIDVRSQSMVFLPTALQRLLEQRLQARQEMAATTANQIF